MTSDGSGASVANQHNQQSVVESQPIRTLPHSKGKSRFNSIFDEDDDEEVDDSHCEVSKDVAGESLLVQKIQRVTASLQNVSVSGITDQVASEKATPQNLPVVEPARRIIDDKLITEESLTSHQSTAHKKFPIGQAEKRNPSIEQSSSEAQKPVPSFESSRRLSTVKKALKSLFSSSSSEAESEEEVLAEQERTVPISAQVEEGKLSEEEMSRPVLKSFDAKFSDRLSAALKNGPVMRPVRYLLALSSTYFNTFKNFYYLQVISILVFFL